MLMLRIVALALASATAQAAETPGLIAGYHALTDVDSYLERDLVQQELERLLEDSNEKATCPRFTLGKKFYNGQQDAADINPDFPDGGVYLKSIPTYGNGNNEVQSAEYVEYIKWAQGSEIFHKKWVKGAFDMEVVSNGQMKADFTNGTAFPKDPFQSGQCVGFEESVKKATSYVYNFVEAVQLMQASIESARGGCIYQQDDCDTAVKYWDAAVAIYVGSIEGDFGRSQTSGKSNYALANKRCRNFKNCGPERNEGNSKDRISPINTRILATFSAGQHAAFAGDWALMTDYKKLISAKMVVPWIQGTLRYAWRLSSEISRAGDALTSSIDPLDKSSGDENVDPDLPAQADLIPPGGALQADYSILDKEVGEAAAFALGSVPKLWACSSKAGKIVWPQLAPGQGRSGTDVPVNFQLVKLAFECNYKCLLTSCTEVGSLHDGKDKQGLIQLGDSDDTIDGKVDIRNGAKTCKDSEFGTDPFGYAQCKKTQKKVKKGKCKLLIGGALKVTGQKFKRDALQYFAETLP